MLIRFDDRIRHRPREVKDCVIENHTEHFPLYVSALLRRLGSSLIRFVSEHAPKDWLAFIHPEGALFFCHKVKVRLYLPLWESPHPRMTTPKASHHHCVPLRPTTTVQCK